MTVVIPLAVAGILTLVAFVASAKDKKGAPQLPPPKPGTMPGPVQTTPAGAEPATAKSAPAGALPPNTVPKTGDNQVVHADDAFDEALAKAIANHDIPSLLELAKQAQAKGLNTVAKSIQDEIARLQQATGQPVIQPIAVVPDKPPVQVPPTAPRTPATYIVKSGDTGEKISLAYTGVKNRWPELLAPVNPNKTRDATYGIRLYAGERINLPASWPTGVPVLPPTPTPAAPPAIASIPAAPTALSTYTVVAGDTGEKVAVKFGKPKGAWTELLKVNPTLASAQYGIALYTGHKINLPATWPAVPVTTSPILAPTIAPPPTPTPPMPTAPPAAAMAPESDARAASRELTDYLVSIGSLAGRYKEDRARVTGYQSRMGTTADGKYGRGTASIVMQNGYVPVAPYYWPSTNTTQAKNDFMAMVKNYAAADPQRKSQWDKLLADTIRS